MNGRYYLSKKLILKVFSLKNNNLNCYKSYRNVFSHQLLGPNYIITGVIDSGIIVSTKLFPAI